MRPSARRMTRRCDRRLTWTGGGVSEARKLVKAEGLRVSRRGKPVRKARRLACWNEGR
jgi:hypothetical protein